MREILFRGKRPCNGNWIEGYFAPFASNKGLKHSIYTGLTKVALFRLKLSPKRSDNSRARSTITAIRFLRATL